VIAVLSINAQFKLTKEGFFNSSDETKNYVVFEYNSMSKETLYNNVLKFITANYKSAKDVTSKVDNEVITINAIQPKKIKAKRIYYDLYYTIVINFKDDKIKIDAPTFECKSYALDRHYRLTMSGSNGGFGSEVTVGLFKKNGEHEQKDAIKELELFFNDLSELIHQSASGKTNNDDNW
jgi:hypothetical protein